MKRPSDDAAESGTVVSPMMEPIALTTSSPDTAGAGRTAVGLQLLKPKRARAGKKESRHSLAPLSLALTSWSASDAVDGSSPARECQGFGCC